MTIRRLQATKKGPGLIRPLLANSREKGLRAVIRELESYYDTCRNDRNLNFKRGEKYSNTWKNRVYSGDDLFAIINIQYLGEVMDNNPPPGKLQQGFLIYFNVYKRKSQDEKLSLKERDNYLSFLESKR